MKITRCKNCGAIQVPGETYLNCYDCGGELFEYEENTKLKKEYQNLVNYLQEPEFRNGVGRISTHGVNERLEVWRKEELYDEWSNALDAA